MNSYSEYVLMKDFWEIEQLFRFCNFLRTADALIGVERTKTSLWGIQINLTVKNCVTFNLKFFWTLSRCIKSTRFHFHVSNYLSCKCGWCHYDNEPLMDFPKEFLIICRLKPVSGRTWSIFLTCKYDELAYFIRD